MYHFLTSSRQFLGTTGFQTANPYLAAVQSGRCLPNEPTWLPIVFLPRVEITCLEDGGVVKVPVFCIYRNERSDKFVGEPPVRVLYSTLDGTATAGVQYVATHGTLQFSATGEDMIEIPIIANKLWNPNFYFVVEIKVVEGEERSCQIVPNRTRVVIQDDDIFPMSNLSDLSVSTQDMFIRSAMDTLDPSVVSVQGGTASRML